MTEFWQTDLYTDGGVIGRNPSSLGGTWAWCLVDTTKNKRLAFDSGVITPQDIGLPVVTNNLTELFAALQGLLAIEAREPLWQGFLWSDSIITLRRLTFSSRFKGVPGGLKQLCLKIRRNKRWTPLLCKGHPTKSDLEVGYSKRGRPVSKHNVFVDKCCNKLAKKFLEGKKDG